MAAKYYVVAIGVLLVCVGVDSDPIRSRSDVSFVPEDVDKECEDALAYATNYTCLKSHELCYHKCKRLDQSTKEKARIRVVECPEKCMMDYQNCCSERARNSERCTWDCVFPIHCSKEAAQNLSDCYNKLNPPSRD